MSTLQGRVLVVDDEGSIRRALSATLGNLGFDVATAASGEEALAKLGASVYDVVLLDINMPGMGGVAACREIRTIAPRVAIVMLTVRDSEDDKVEALEAGADDYVTKPFHIRELIARVRAGVRRTRAPQTAPEAIIRIGDVELDPARRLVRKAGQPVHVTPKEFDLLTYLMSHAGLPATHTRLLHEVWGPEYGGEVEYLRTFMRQLRKKLEDDPGDPKYLLTDSHIGYRFCAAPADSPPVAVDREG